MIKNNKVEEIKKILLKSLDNEDFVKELLEKYAGNEELILKMIEESFSELMEEANPYKWTPVSPATFLTDPYYLGKNEETGIGVCETLHEQLFKDFCELHGPDSEYNEAILTGGIGWGKSFFMEVSLLWQLYILSCLKHPQKYFELASNTKITVMIISITEKQGKKNMFSGVKEALKIIPYFKENFQYDDKRSADSLLFPNNIELMSATSSHSSTIGLNIYSAALDEANFFKKVSNSKRAQDAGEIFDEALVLYQSVRRRLDARFLKKGHKPGIFYIGSSKVYPNDFTSERINKAMELEKEKGEKRCFIMDYNLWKVNRAKYSNDEFRVEIGGLNRRSRILDEWDNDIVGEVIHVPMDFYDKFQSDIDNAIRDIAGIGIYTVQPFIGNKEYIGKMFESGSNIGLEKIFSVETATLSPKPAHMSLEYLLNVPIRHPNKIRYIGLDIGLKKDKFGFCLTGDTEVTMSGGIVKKLADVRIGDVVVDMFGEQKRVINKFDNGKKDTITIKYSGIFLTGTPEHKVLCLKRNKITKWGAVIMPHSKKYKRMVDQLDYTPTWVKLSDVDVGDYLVNTEHLFSEELDWDNKFCWLYGMYLAEGSTVKKENKVCWSISKNENIFAGELIRIIREKLNRHAWTYQMKNCNCQIVKSHCLDVFKDYVTDLAHNKHIKPHFFNKLNNDQIYWILMGLMDGDGGISETEVNHQMKWTTVSESLANQIYIMLTKLGFMPKHNKSFEKFSTHEIHRIMLSGNDYFKWLGVPKTNKNDMSYSFKHKHMVFYPITEKESGGEHLVYDIEVESTHSYIANGVIVHNCMGYIDGMEQVERSYFDAETQTMKTYKEKMPRCVVEMLLSIQKEEEFGEVELGRVRYLIFQMIKKGYRIRMASMDGFQSADFIQILKRNNIETSYISMDKTTEPYETFRTALYEERISSIYHPLLELELNELERDYVRGKIDHNVRSCLLGDTKIKLLNGKHVQISELVGQENVELYGCTESGIIVPTVAKKIWETKKVKEYLEVTLDNGEVVKCTVEHPFMMRDGSYKRADQLIENDSLMPLYTDFNGKWLKGYERVQCNKTGIWRYTHALVDEFYNGKRPDGVVVHHYDIDPKNNSNANLERMTREEHGQRHAMLNELGRKNIKTRIETFKKNVRLKAGLPEDSVDAPWKVKRRLALKTQEEIQLSYKKRTNAKWILMVKENGKKLNNGYWKTEEGKKRRAELSKTQLKDALIKRLIKEEADWINKFDSTKDYYSLKEIINIYGGGKVAVKRRLSIIGYEIKTRNEEQKRNRRAKVTEINDNLWLSKFDNTKEYESIHEIRRNYGGNRIDILRRLDKIGFTNVKSFKKRYSDGQKSTYNHKVISVKKILLDNEIPVYDIEVPLTSNFGLSAGIFVHNSKDLSDAVGQIIYNMHINPMCSESPMLPVAFHDANSVSSIESLEDTLENFNKWARM